MHRHLIAIKICIVGSTHQRMQLDCLAFNQHRFKGLNTKPVKRRCSVQQYRMLPYHLFENVPDFKLLVVYHLL